MKKIIILTGSILISTSTLGMAASPASLSQSLGAAWKSHTTVPTPHNDMNIVYGGADISRRPTSIQHTTTA